MKRKRIGLLTICPENEYPQRVMSGVFAQCEKYGYDVVVISPLVSICNYYQSYLDGDLNIYEIINFELFDGFIITPIPMTENRNTKLYDYLLKKIKKECKKPVVSMDLEFGEYPTVYTDDRTAFYHIAEHLIKRHKCKKISVLGGLDSISLSNARLNGIKDAMEENNLSFDDVKIYEGDYWYTSGENLANRYISGELKLPDAIICLSDHMAIGLTNKLVSAGIKVPKQVRITGYEAVKEAAINTPAITSYAAEQVHTGASAVNMLMKLIDPNFKTILAVFRGKKNLCIGGTCGCKEDTLYTRAFLKKAHYNLRQNFDHDEVWNSIDMGQLLESYLTESLTATNSPFECLCKIYGSKYLLQPHKNFYLCLNSSWLDPTVEILKGYTPKMNLALSVEAESQLRGFVNHIFLGDNGDNYFDTKEMLPSLNVDTPKPQVFYFSPVHFNEKSLGYAVIQNDLENPGYLTEEYRNYLRIVNNALEMVRTKYQISYLSEHDPMTGLKNRRGMVSFIDEKLKNAQPSDSMFAIVADMDNLKFLNDNFGHAVGDEGIRLVGKAMQSIHSENDVCVRSGGDEFYLVGIGPYTESDIQDKVEQFNSYLQKENKDFSVPITASIGYAISSLKDATYEHLLDLADERMYKEKRQKKAGKQD